VVGKAKAIPSNKANAKAAKKEYAKVVKQLKKDASSRPSGNTVYAGKDTLRSTILRLLPDVEVRPGRHDRDVLDVAEDHRGAHDLVRSRRLPAADGQRLHRA
jgi:hypothetical protein